MKFLIYPTTFLLISCQLSIAQPLLPDRMVGVWRGHLQIWSKGVKQDSVEVELTIAPLGQERWKWKMKYKSDKTPMVKDYEIALKDKTKQIYITDEGGGTVLEDYAFGNKLFSQFQTQDYWLTSTQELQYKKIIFEVTAGKRSEGTSNGVINYNVSTLQRAVLELQE